MLDNELLADSGVLDNPLLENSVEAGDTSERVYDYTNDRERTQDQQMGINMFYQNYSSKVTEDELRSIFNSENNGQLQRVFGSFDNYLAYMDERQDLIDAGVLDADWWSPDEALFDPSTLPSEIVGNDQATEEYIRDLQVKAAEEGYQEQAILRETLLYKYTGIGGSTTWNEDGDKFEWNGTSWVQTASAWGENWGSIVGEFIKSFIVSGASWAASTALANLAVAGIAKYGSSAVQAIKNAGSNVLTLAGTVDGAIPATELAIQTTEQLSEFEKLVNALSTVAGGVTAVGITDWDPYDENQEYVDPNEEALALYNMMLNGELPEGFSFTADGNLNPGDGEALDPATLISVLWGFLKDLFKNDNGEWEPPDNGSTTGGPDGTTETGTPPKVGDACETENGEAGVIADDGNGNLFCQKRDPVDGTSNPGGIDPNGNGTNTTPKAGDPCGEDNKGVLEDDGNGGLYCKMPELPNTETGPKKGDPCTTFENGAQTAGVLEEDEEGNLYCKTGGVTAVNNPPPKQDCDCGNGVKGTWNAEKEECDCPSTTTGTTSTTTTTTSTTDCDCGNGVQGTWNAEKEECDCPSLIQTQTSTPSPVDEICDCGNGVQGTWNAEKGECDCPSVINKPTPTNTTTTETTISIPAGTPTPAGGVNPTSTSWSPLFKVNRGRGYTPPADKSEPIGSIFGDISIEDILK